LISIPVITADL